MYIRESEHTVDEVPCNQLQVVLLCQGESELFQTERSWEGKLVPAIAMHSTR